LRLIVLHGAKKMLFFTMPWIRMTAWACFYGMKMRKISIQIFIFGKKGNLCYFFDGKTGVNWYI